MADVVLIVDDNETFRRLLQQNLELSEFDARICDPLGYQSLKDLAPPSGRFEVLLDFSLPLEWLQELEQDEKLARRLRIWVVTGVPDADIGDLRARYRRLNIQTRWFDKADPRFPDKLEVAIRQEADAENEEKKSWRQLKQSVPESNAAPDPAWLQDFPEPIRVLNAKGKVVWTNAKWSANPYTPGVDADELKTILAQQSGQWRESVRWGPLPHTPSQHTALRVKDGYYRLRQRKFEGKDANPTVLQWLDPVIRPARTKLKEEVERVLQEITRTHFTRARFYNIPEVPAKEGIITLEQQAGGLADKYVLPIHRPLRGQILDRLWKYRNINRDQMQKLQYEFFVETEEPHDGEWAAWNRIIGTEDMVDWVEIPVLDKVGKEMRVLGLLICDCQRSQRPGTDPGAIPSEAMEWLESYLRFAVASLRALLRDEAKRRRAAAHEAVTEAWRPLLHATGLENLEHALLQKAVDITKADGGLLLTAVEGTERGLEVRAAVGTTQKKVRRVIPPSAKGLATVDAWATRGMVVEPWFRQSARFHELRSENVWRLLARTPADSSHFQQWFENEIGSLVAAPVKRGEKVIGAVSLHHSAEMHFDPERLVRLDDLLQAAAPLIEAETQRQERTLWLGEVVHRIGARVNAVAGHLEILDQIPPDRREGSLCQATNQARLLRRLLTRIRDQEHPWRIEGDFALQWPERLARVRAALKERYSLPERPVVIIRRDAFCATPRLKGDSDALDMILEEMLGNAWNYSDGDGPISISAENSGPYWLLRIANPGRILREDEDEIFKLDRRGRNARGEGLGLGLPISRSTVRLHAGNLVLEESGTETGRVVFRLEWPYAPQP